jgi:hypothetical protein
MTGQCRYEPDHTELFGHVKQFPSSNFQLLTGAVMWLTLLLINHSGCSVQNEVEEGQLLVQVDQWGDCCSSTSKWQGYLIWDHGGWDGENWTFLRNIWKIKSIGLSEKLNIRSDWKGITEIVPQLLVCGNKIGTVKGIWGLSGPQPPCWRNQYQTSHVDKISNEAGLS